MGKSFTERESVDPSQRDPASPMPLPFTYLAMRDSAFEEMARLPFLKPLPSRKNPHSFYQAQEVKVLSRGDWIWRRDVVSLISPKDASSNLIVGETYNPPGFWSGTPLHQHDGQSSGESDHEEVYYHRFHWSKSPGDQFGPYGVQLLMDGIKLMKAFLIGDKSIFAIPGGCHPVVASPVSELLYLWGLAGRGDELVMRDIPEFLIPQVL